MDKFNLIERNGIKLFNFSNDEDINIRNNFNSVYNELYYDIFLYETEFVKIKPNDIIIDCGANMGLFSAYAANKGKFVYAFEPGKTIFPYLVKTANLYPNIEIIKSAVGNVFGVAKFTDCWSPVGSHLSQYNINQNCLERKQYYVPITKLDIYFNNIKVNFIKIDAEGSEIDILLGGKTIIQRDNPKIAIAVYHFQDEASKVIEIIKSFNNNYNFEKKGDIVFAWI